MRSSARAVLAAAIIGSSMTFMDGTVVNVALPVLREKLGATAGEVQWIIESYMLFLSSLILAGGSLGDRWGRRLVFAAGIGLFAAASAWCGLASSARQLIVARGVQGIGAALLVPGSLALITANFSEERRGRAIGTWAAVTSMAAGVGPLLGGWLVEHVSWRWIFFLNLPLAALALLIVWWRVPESRGGAQEGEIDWLGTGLATVALFGIVFGLIEGESRGFETAIVIASLAGGVLTLFAFVMVEHRGRHPMLPLELFRSRNFAGANLLTLLLYCALSAATFILPFTLIARHGYSPVEAAAAFLPFVIVMLVLSRWAGRMMDRHGPKLPLTAGPAIAAIGFALFTMSAKSGAYWTHVFPPVLIMSLGMAITVAPLTTTVMTSVDESRAGLASGINNAVSRVASLMAVALAGVITGGAFEAGLTRVAWFSAALAAGAAASAAFIVRRVSRTKSP